MVRQAACDDSRVKPRRQDAPQHTAYLTRVGVGVRQPELTEPLLPCCRLLPHDRLQFGVESEAAQPPFTLLQRGQAHLRGHRSTQVGRGEAAARQASGRRRR